MVAAVAAKAHWKNHSAQRPWPPEGFLLEYLVCWCLLVCLLVCVLVWVLV
jgi:hypothetical protein